MTVQTINNSAGYGSSGGTLSGGYWCGLHGQFWGNQCPSCSSVAPLNTLYIYPTVPPPLSGTEAIQAIIREYTAILTDLRQQLDDVNRKNDVLEKEIYDRDN